MAGTRGTGLSPSGSSIIPAGGNPALVQYASQSVADGSQAAVAQVLTNTIDVPTTITGSGNVNLVVQAMGFNGGVPLVVPCALTVGNSASSSAGSIRGALNADATFAAFFAAVRVGDDVIVTFDSPANNDLWASFTVTPTTALGINASSSTITTPGNAEGCQADFVGCLVTGIGAGSYRPSGLGDINGGDIYPYFNLVGSPISKTQNVIIANLDDGIWQMKNGAGVVINATESQVGSFPWQDVWTGSTVSPISTPCTAGDTVTVGLSYDSSASFTTPPTFVGGVALTLVATETNAGVTAAIYKGVAAGGETGVRYILDSAVRASMQVVEFSSLGAVEDTSVNSGTGGALAFSTVTPTSASNLIFGVGAYANATQDYIAGPTSPFTRLGTGAGGASVWQEVVYAIQETATPQGGNMGIEMNDSHDTATVAAAIGGA